MGTTPMFAPTSQNLKRKSSSKKQLVIGCASTLIIVALIIRFAGISSNSENTHVSITPKFGMEIRTPPPFVPPKENGRTYCFTSTCKDAAQSILESMDQRADPCNDFYKYACGGWIRDNPLPEGSATWENFQILQLKNLLDLKSVIDNEREVQSTAEKKARAYYESCLDTDGIVEELGSAPILELLNKIGGWNVIGNFDVDEWDLQKALQVMHNLPTANKLFSWMVGVDVKNSSQNNIELDQGVLGLRSRDLYINSDVQMLAMYLKYMKSVGTLLGGDEESTISQMAKVIAFELQLAKIMVPENETKNLDRIYNKIKMSELMKLAPAVDWLQYFNYAFQRVDRRILSSDDVIVSVPNFMRNMSELLTKYLSTNEGKIVLNNYLGWSLIQGMASFLPKSFQIDDTIIEKTAAGSSDDLLWPSCLLKTDKVIGFALGAMFIRRKFPSDIRPAVEEMINEIRSAIKKNLPLLDWLDDDTRKLIKEKMDAINVMVGFPQFSMDPQKLDQYYEELIVRKDEYFLNTLRVRDFNMLGNMKSLGKPTILNKWMLTPSTVNAYYSPLRNQIVVPAGILQEPFYNPLYPKSISFGRFGFLIGHELMHALDNTGRLFDKLGNLHPWWKNSTIERFEERAQCFVDQYSTYYENGVYLNGQQTLPDNIADNGGLKAALHAYESWEQKHSKEYLPGLSLNQKQLFFVSFAQMWCESITPEAMEESMRKWSHSPHKYRVIGTITNSADFAKEFGCSKRISQRKKCELW